MKKIIILIMSITVIVASSYSQTTVKMEKKDGVYMIPCSLNGLKLKFIFDTGAGDVSISLTEALFMLKNNYLKKEDILGTEQYSIANGDIAEGTKIIIRELKIGDKTLNNVEASIIHTDDAPLLLGQSAIKRFGEYSMNNVTNILTLGQKVDSPNQINPFMEQKRLKTTTTASGLEYIITKKGHGKKAEAGDKITVNYTGKLTNDTVFDSSIPRGQPFEFKLGAGQVIKGWDEAFALLQEGDKATIKLPPTIAYGDRAMGKIPANATLIFDIELLKVTEGLKQWSAKGREKDTITTKSGLKLIIFNCNKDGASCAGAKVTVHYSGFFRDGKMFDSSVERGKPFSLKCGSGQVIPGWDEGLSMLHKGDKAKMIIPYMLAYGEAGRPPQIPAKSDLIFDVEIIDVTPVAAPVQYNIAGMTAQTTASGLKYYTINKSTNPLKAEAGKMVKVHYSGYLADGKMFDSSVERGEPIEFPLGQGQVIPGWEEGISLMNVGDKLRIIIPYFLAYGEAGRPPQIPAKADLTFDVELIDVRDGAPQGGH